MYNKLVEWNNKNKLFILVDDPKSVFMKLLLELTEIIKNIKFFKPGNDCYVGPNVFIEEDSVVGHDVMFMGNNYIYGGSSIGNNVVLKPGTVIGGCGYGFLTNEGKHTILPHIGGVIIEDDVLIGANTCIDSGLLGNTVIKQGAKIDNLVHIAHNVVIGRNTIVIANAMVAGSVKVGDNSQISPSVSIRQQIIVGSDVVVGMHNTREIAKINMAGGLGTFKPDLVKGWSQVLQEFWGPIEATNRLHVFGILYDQAIKGKTNPAIKPIS